MSAHSMKYRLFLGYAQADLHKFYLTLSPTLHPKCNTYELLINGAQPYFEISKAILHTHTHTHIINHIRIINKLLRHYA
jgi:hypothetical protein